MGTLALTEVKAGETAGVFDGAFPVRETLVALEQGGATMAEAVAEKNGQVCVTTATGADPVGAGLRPARPGGAAMEDRRAAVRAAMLGGRLTPAFLKELCVTLGGGEAGRGGGKFAHWSVTALAVGAGRVPAGHSGPETGGGAAETRPTCR